MRTKLQYRDLSLHVIVKENYLQKLSFGLDFEKNHRVNL